MRYLVEVFDRPKDGENTGSTFRCIRNRINVRSLSVAFEVAAAMQMADHDAAVLVSIHVPRFGWMYIHTDDIQGTLDDVNAVLSQALHDVKQHHRNRQVKAA